jgi:hypothetical protein
VTPRQRKLGLHVVEHVLQQVAERGVGVRSFGLRRPGDQRPGTPSGRELDAALPQRRLPDPGLPLQHERRRRGRRTGEERLDRPQLVVASDDRRHAGDRDGSGAT